MEVKLECSECGADGTGSCGCGAPYIPKKRRVAIDGVKANPNLSGRALAKELGVSRHTVQQAKKHMAGVTSHTGTVITLPKRESNGVVLQGSSVVLQFVRPEPTTPAQITKREKVINDLCDRLNRHVQKLDSHFRRCDFTTYYEDGKYFAREHRRIAAQFSLLIEELEHNSNSKGKST